MRGQHSGGMLVGRCITTHNCGESVRGYWSALAQPLQRQDRNKPGVQMKFSETKNSPGTLRSIGTFLVIMLCLTPVQTMGGQLCGNGLLNQGEQCDDGNNSDGDGCTRLCDIEAGYQCTDPYVRLEPNQVIQDGGFEFGPNAAWGNAASIEPLVCNTEECASTPAGARNGIYWAQLGGVAEQDWALFQDANFTTQARVLKFDVMHFNCPSTGSNDLFAVTINGNGVWFSGASNPGCTNGQRYVTTVVDLDNAPGGPYANAGQVEFGLQLDSNTGQLAMAIDNIEVGKLAAPPVPSICTINPNVSLFTDFEDINEPLADPDFEQAVLGEVGIKWGTTSDGFCGTAQSPPGNHTGEPGAACIDSSFLAPLSSDDETDPRDLDDMNRVGIQQANSRFANVVETYVCNAPVDLKFKLQSSLQLVVNYQPGQTTGQDFFGVWVGPSPFFGPLASGTGTARLLVNEQQGIFGESPGVAYEFDISDQDGEPEVYVCFGYGNESGGYAQVDTVILSSGGCTDDFEEDKILSCSDNCKDVVNPSQRDSDNDGYGNACDGDIAKNAAPATEADNASGNDCVVNFSDLITFSDAIFSEPTSENWNPDADLNADNVVNFGDLAVFSQLFLKAPGPSGVSSTCGASET